MEQQLSIPPGKISGAGVVRDSQGNIKAEFTFSAPATKEQAQELGLLPKDEKECQ